MKKRFWVIFIAVLIVGFGVFLFIIRQPEQKKEETPSALFPEMSTDMQQAENSSSFGSKLVFTEPKALEFKPFFEEEGEKISDIFLEKFSSLTNPRVLEKSKSEEQISPEKPRYTEEELFRMAFPDFYAEYLNTLQNLMLEDGLLKTDELSAFKNEEEIYSFLLKFVDYATNKGFIEQDQEELLKNGIDVTLRGLIEKEKIMRQNGLMSFGNRLFINKILGFLMPKARAQGAASSGGAAAAAKDCFRSGPPVPGGVNLWAPCCNCKCYNYNCGCLNAACTKGAAIWDPWTGICGCG